MSTESNAADYSDCTTHTWFQCFFTDRKHWALTKSEERRLMPLAGNVFVVSATVRWSDFITNMEIQKRTCAQPLSTVIQRRRLSLLGHVARMPGSSDNCSLLVADVPGDWRHPRGRRRSSWRRTVRADLDLMDTLLEGAISIAKERASWRQMIDDITHRATLPMQE